MAGPASSPLTPHNLIAKGLTPATTPGWLCALGQVTYPFCASVSQTWNMIVHQEYLRNTGGGRSCLDAGLVLSARARWTPCACLPTAGIFLLTQWSSWVARGAIHGEADVRGSSWLVGVWEAQPGWPGLVQQSEVVMPELGAQGAWAGLQQVTAATGKLVWALWSP